MRRLALYYEISKMSILYEETTATWDNAEFTFNKDFTAHLILWEDGIEPEQISETWKRLEGRAESFRVALKYLGNHSVEVRKEKDYPTYYFDDRQFTPRTEEEISVLTEFLQGRIESFEMGYIKLPEVSISGTMILSPVPLPQKIPTIPFDLHRISETIVAANELAKYPDLVMKLAYIILEEFKSYIEKEELDRFRFVRDFVSHSTCDKRETLITYIGKELPSSKAVTDEGKAAVRFNRNDKDHISFVAKHAYPALQRAKELFNEKVKTEGGFL